jgi:hypothetical protein
MSYLDDLKKEILEKHGCRSIHIATVSIIDLPEGSGGKTVVEVFDLPGHPKTDTCYAWRNAKSGVGTDGEISTVLRLAPITNAKKAVLAELAALSR